MDESKSSGCDTQQGGKMRMHYSSREDPPNPMVFVAGKPRAPLKFCCKKRRQRVFKCQRDNVNTRMVVENPIGFAFGTLRIDDFLDRERENSLLLQGFATCLVAFGEIFLTPEAEWSHNTLNGLLQEGANHVKNSLKNYEGDANEVNVISKCFTLRRNGMEVFVSDPILIGTIECMSPRVYSFGVGIAMFLRKFQYCLLRVENRFYLIWKKQHAHFLFDCYGRAVTGQSDFKNGDVALICVGSSKKIDILITYLGHVSPDAVYTLYQLKMLRLVPCCDEPFICSGQPRKNEYEVISDHHARLQGTYHLGSDCFKGNRFKQPLAIGLVAVIYSKIDAPCTWDSKIVNKVLILGNRCYSNWTQHNPEKCLYLQHIPRQFPVGQYLAEVVIFPAVYCGNWINLPNFEVCEITRAVKNAFQELKSLNILVQVDRKAYSIWKRNGLFYLLDPYPMELVQAASKSNCRKNATVHMFSTLKLLCCVLTQQIIGLSIPCKFIIHVVKILKLTMVSSQTVCDDWPVSCVDPQAKMGDEEVASLNESVYDIECEKELACTQELYDIGYCDLDVPPLSETQNLQPVDIIEESAPSEDDDFTDLEEEAEGEENEEEEEEEEEESEEESEEDKIPGKRPGRPKPGRKPKKQSKKGKGGESGSSDEYEAKSKGKGKGKGKGKNKGKGKGGNESSEDEKKGGKGKDKKDKAKDKGKGKGKGKTSDDESSEEKGKKGKAKTKKDKEKEKKDKEKEKKDKEKEKKDKEKEKKDKEKEKKDKEKEKKDKEKEKKEKEKEKKQKEKEEKEKKEKEKKEKKEKEKKQKQTGKDKSKGKSSGKESTDEKDTDGKSEKEKGKDKGKDTKDKKKQKPGPGGISSDEITPSASEGSVPSMSNKSLVSSASDTSRKERYGKYGVCPPGIEPKGGWPKGSGCLPKSYPGYTHVARNLAVVGSETGTYQSICQLIRSAFQVADRILTMTAWGNYVVFKNMASYLLYDGCTCNPCRFRNIDLSVGTAGLLCFDNLHDLIIEILKGKNRSIAEQTKPLTIDDICNEYC